MENNNEIKNSGPWWRDGVIVFTKVSAYIVGPIIIASYFGKILDEKYNKDNLFFYILIALGFLSTIYLIWNEVKIYKKKIEKEDKNKI